MSKNISENLKDLKVGDYVIADEMINPEEVVYINPIYKSQFITRSSEENGGDLHYYHMIGNYYVLSECAIFCTEPITIDPKTHQYHNMKIVEN